MLISFLTISYIILNVTGSLKDHSFLQLHTLMILVINSIALTFQQGQIWLYIMTTYKYLHHHLLNLIIFFRYFFYILTINSFYFQLKNTTKNFLHTPKITQTQCNLKYLLYSHTLNIYILSFLHSFNLSIRLVLHYKLPLLFT